MPYLNNVTNQKEVISYADYLRKVQNGDIGIDVNDFSRQFILNHLDNYRFTYKPISNNLAYVKGLLRTGKVISTNFEISLDAQNINPQFFVVKQEKEANDNLKTTFKPVIIVDDVAYMAETLGPVRGNTMKYKRASVQGIKNKSMMYKSESERNLDDGNNKPLGVPPAAPGAHNDEGPAQWDGGVYTDEQLKEGIINGYIDLLLYAGNIVAEEKEDAIKSLRKNLLGTPRQDLIDTIVDIKKDIQVNGLKDNTGIEIC
jgi:hypothetical protein